MFNDDWMRERGFLEEEITKAEDVIKDHIDKPLNGLSIWSLITSSALVISSSKKPLSDNQILTLKDWYLIIPIQAQFVI